MSALPYILLSTALMSSVLPVCAQTWEDVKADGERYIWAEGWGQSVDEADREAMASLAGKISLTIISEFKSVEGQSTSGRETTRYSSIDHNVHSFSTASLSGSGVEILQGGRQAHVVRWIGRDEIARMRMRRSEHVIEYVRNARENELAGRFSDALRGYYWAYAMIRAYPEISSTVFVDGEGNARVLSVWLPQTISRMFSDMRVTVSSASERQATLTFLYGGRQARGVEFSYFDGTGWTENMYSQEGRRTVDLNYNTRPDYLHVRFEYLFANDVKADRELEFALEFLKDEPVRKSYMTLYFR